MSSDIAIRISNLSKCYEIYDAPSDRLKQFVYPRFHRLIYKSSKQFFHEFWSLKDVSLEINKGETVGIIGRNGSGKSTLLQIICGTLSPTGGAVETNGRIAALLELGSGFNPEFTGRENIYMNATVLGLTLDEIDRCYGDIVDFADIGEFINQPVKSYSSGMMVRLAFSVSVFVDPEILIVDEALAVGDAVFQFKCLERLKQLTQSGTTLLFVSHDIQMVKSFCRRAVYLHKGEIKAEGKSEDIAEYYIKDVRNEQQKQSSVPMLGMIKKQFVGGADGIAFGTTQGRITNVYFDDEQGRHATFLDKDVAIFVVELEYASELDHPFITVVLQNSKLIELGGKSFPLNFSEGENSLHKGQLKFELPLSLGTGCYFFTIKLESRKSSFEFYPVDKQVGVLDFTVSRSKEDFTGSIDVGLQLVGQQGL